MQFTILGLHHLEYFTSLIVKLNDLFLVANPWIISTSANPDLGAVLPSPLLLSAVYGVLEPLYTKTLLWLPVPIMMYATLLTGTHMFAVARTAKIIDARAGGPQQQQQQQQQQQHDPDQGDNQSDVATPPQQRPSISSPGAIFRCLFLPLQTAALSNAIQLILYNRLAMQAWKVEKIYESDIVNKLSEAVPLLTYIYLRKWDLELSQKTSRALYIGHHRGTAGWLSEQLACLLVLIGTRTVMRAMLGIDVWIAFRQPSAARAREMFGLDSYQAVGDFIVSAIGYWNWLGLPSWTTVKNLYFASIVLWIVWWLVGKFRGRRRQVEGEQRQ